MTPKPIIDHLRFIQSKIDPGADDLEPVQVVQGNLRQWADEIERLTERGEELERLRVAASDVCWFDWSNNNDDDAVASIDALRRLLSRESGGYALKRKFSGEVVKR